MNAPFVVFICVSCRAQNAACPECVNTILIDPETQLPPDVKVVNGDYVPIKVDPEAYKRSNPHPVCDKCIQAANRRGKNIVTSIERHKRNHP